MNYPLASSIFMAIAGLVGVLVDSYPGTGLLLIVAGSVGAVITHLREK